jgi:DUF4097 and DUF4098 domain-containing protein YvlB
VTLAAIAGAATVRSSYGTVRASQVGGALRVTGSSSEVSAQDIGGPIDVETSYGGVALSRVRDAVTIRIQSGTASLSGLSGKALTAEHRIETTYGDIEVAWPRGSQPRFHLESSGGSVKSDFAGNEREVGSRLILDGAAGAAGSGQLSLAAQSGSVRLRAE